ncbi:MAG: hypothetical protein J2P31_06500, partial [Blastocatellia bacterium]|nr:hypothetical protein [Blastocatellia bacterium]
HVARRISGQVVRVLVRTLFASIHKIERLTGAGLVSEPRSQEFQDWGMEPHLAPMWQRVRHENAIT